MFVSPIMQAGTAISPAAEEAKPRILRPSENCWRIDTASRAAVLVDAADYFCRLENVLHQAERSILIVGWDFDGRIRLCPDKPLELSRPLGALLRGLVEAKPELEVHILVWSVAILHAPGAPLPLLLGSDWDDHPRIHVKLDTRHPIYAAHHQKIVCIDDVLAFAGGIDLTVERWDTCDHREAHPRRLNPDGSSYNPVHDIQMAVEGEAARALAELVRERWLLATGYRLEAVDQDKPCWPTGLRPDFIDMPVAIARTYPAWGGTEAVREVERLTLDCLRFARRSIYIEAQYLTAASVGDALAEKLEEPTGPEIVVILTRSSQGAVEHLVMGENRDRLMRKLHSLDRHERLRIFYPTVPGRHGECEVHIHAKLIVVDDVFMRVGSSNLNNRSMGLDTECDLAIEARTSGDRQTIARLRDGLLAEHLGCDPKAVASIVAERGSLSDAIARLNTNDRGLRPLMPPDGPTDPLIGTRIFDPHQPLDLFSLLHGHRSGR